MASLEDDDLIKYMRKMDIPLTRSAWLMLNWGSSLPEPWTAEHELELPDELQDMSKVEPDETIP